MGISILGYYSYGNRYTQKSNKVFIFDKQNDFRLLFLQFLSSLSCALLFPVDACLFSIVMSEVYLLQVQYCLQFNDA